MPFIGAFTRHEPTVEVEVNDIDDRESGNKTANGGGHAGGANGLRQHLKGECAQQDAAGQARSDRKEKGAGPEP